MKSLRDFIKRAFGALQKKGGTYTMKGVKRILSLA